MLVHINHSSCILWLIFVSLNHFRHSSEKIMKFSYFPRSEFFTFSDMWGGGRSKRRQSVTWGEWGSNIAIFGEILFKWPHRSIRSIRSKHIQPSIWLSTETHACTYCSIYSSSDSSSSESSSSDSSSDSSAGGAGAGAYFPPSSSFSSW